MLTSTGPSLTTTCSGPSDGPNGRKVTPNYRLLGTITESEIPSLAVLQERRSKRTHIVTLGDTLGDFHVFRIQHKQVTLRKGNQLAILTLENALFLSPTPRMETEPN